MEIICDYPDKNDNYVDENEVDKDIMLMYCKHI